jgi:Ni/Co efflux regulator RcnB
LQAGPDAGGKHKEETPVKKLITAALIAAVAIPAVAVPTAASAQNREHRGDHRDGPQDRGGDRRGPDRGQHDDRRGGPDRRDDRGGRWDQRGDRGERADRDRNWGANDWNDHRGRNRGLYARGNWNAPFRYQSFRPGLRIGLNFYSPRYRISDPWRYHLPRPGWNQVWVRHYNDLLLVDTRRGTVIRVIRGFYW